ncbi:MULTISPECIES: nuclear transport factor 2 family protein [Polaromonas]|uniref:Nuclear transport factor 2 family protein n=1 Tax=Polaromonas aquatica TaxID=332657 RepID=A0ABW1U138_9BURK
MTESGEDLLQTLLDREAIRELMYAYCRGIDRCDEAALRSVYWPDATHRQGAYSESGSSFVDYAMKARSNGLRMSHHVSNISIVLKGKQAAVEGYFQAFQYDGTPQGGLLETLLNGRYINRVENRGGEWRIAERTLIYDWIKQTPATDGNESQRFGERSPNGRMKPDDAWYKLLGQAPFSS